MPRNSGVKCLLQTVCKVLEVRTSSHSSNEKEKNPVNNVGGLRELYNTPHLWDVLTLRLHTAKLISLLTLFFLNFKIKNYDLTAQNSPVVQTAISELDFLVFLEYCQNSRDKIFFGRFMIQCQVNLYVIDSKSLSPHCWLTATHSDSLCNHLTSIYVSMSRFSPLWMMSYSGKVSLMRWAGC